MTRTYRPSQSYLHEVCASFNERFPVGTAVILRMDKGERACFVRGPASVLSGHSAVAWFTGLSGCYSIEDDRVRLAAPEVAAGMKALTGSSSL